MMSDEVSHRRKVLRSLSVLAGFATLSSSFAACGRRYDEAIWTEEVKLHDGKMIQVWRRATRQPSGFPVAPRGRELEVELRYEPSNVHWKGDGTRQPLSFEIFDGVPHLVLFVRERKWCEGKPSEEIPAEFFAWKLDGWQQIPKSSIPLNTALANLYIRYWGHGPDDDAKGLITWPIKAKEDSFFPNAPNTVQRWYERTGNNCKLYQSF
jgi:hypothetical protein